MGPARRKRGSRRSRPTPPRATLTPRLFFPPFPGNSRQPMGARRRGASREDRPAVRAAVAPQGQPGDKKRKVDARGGRAGTHARAVNYRRVPVERARVARVRPRRATPASFPRAPASRVARPAASRPHASRGHPLTNNRRGVEKRGMTNPRSTVEVAVHPTVGFGFTGRPRFETDVFRFFERAFWKFRTSKTFRRGRYSSPPRTTSRPASRRVSDHVSHSTRSTLY